MIIGPDILRIVFPAFPIASAVIHAMQRRLNHHKNFIPSKTGEVSTVIEKKRR